MVRKFLIYAILIVHENTHEIYKHCVQVGLDDWDTAKKYQAHLWHKTWQNLTGIIKCENIRLIQTYIYHDYSKGPEAMAIHHQLL